VKPTASRVRQVSGMRGGPPPAGRGTLGHAPSGQDDGSPVAWRIPRQPAGLEWHRREDRILDGFRVETWRSGPVLVTSGAHLMDGPDGGPPCWQWKIAISNLGKRPKPAHVRRALRAFGMTEAEQDNHEPGNAVHFFLVCDPSRRVECECKADEDVVLDQDGHRWTNPKPETGEPCRGCTTSAVTKRPCPLHRDGVVVLRCDRCSLVFSATEIPSTSTNQEIPCPQCRHAYDVHTYTPARTP
jgi:hypothetical protein